MEVPHHLSRAQISRFQNFQTAPEGDYVWTGEKKVRIDGYGEVDIKMSTPAGGTRLLRLFDVALCEGFVCNLVSLRVLRKKGYYWDNKPAITLIKRPDNSILCTLIEKHGQFIMEDIPEDADRATFFTRRNEFNSWTKRKPSSADALTWHLRLGHPGPQALEHLVNSSQGVRIKGITTRECDACATSKAKRMIRREPRDLFEGLGRRLAIDFHDFEMSMDGYTSCMLITDRWSGYMWDYYLKDRTTGSIITAMKSLFGILEQQYGIKPTVIECDNEIVTQKPGVHRFLQDLSIKVDPSPPYTQALNGAAERSGGVVKDKIRAMRASSRLPGFLWKEIGRSAVYLLNRTPRYQNNWKTPYDRFHTNATCQRGTFIAHRKPDQSHLKIYGCKAFALTTDALKKTHRLQRMNPKAWIGYLVGYNSTNVYRIWNPIKNIVISTRDVTFNENETFSGDIQEWKDDLLHISTEELEDLIRMSSIPAAAEEEEPVQPVQEDLDQSRILEEDEFLVQEPTGQNDQGKHEYTESYFEPYPTPSSTPPAALLAVSIRQAHEEKVPQDEGRVCNMDSWKAAFYTGSQVKVVGKVQTKMITKAQMLRMLRKPRKLHRRDLPPPPKRHADLAEHALGHLFEQAELDHLKSHEDMNSWLEIRARDPRVKGQKVLDCKWVYVYKFDKHSRFQKVKSRLVVRGDQQAKNLTENTYAATLAGRSFRTLMAISARFDLELLQYDAVNAFVNAKLDSDVFMKMPPGHRRQGMIFKLNKALYGLRKSPLLWQKELTRTLTELGFQIIPHEPCCFIKGGIILFFYVDDIVIAYRKHQESEGLGLIRSLKARYALTGGGSLQWFLGIEILRDRAKRLIWLSQSSYIDKINDLVQSTMTEKSTRLPMSKEELLPYEETATNPSCTSYLRKIGSLLYVAVMTRPDVAFAVSRLARFTTNPGPQHQAAADQVLLYLKRTRALALQFGGEDDFVIASDASFADNSLDRKSSQAYAMKLFGGLIGWRASKQDTVTTSTTEAELLALSQAAKEALFVSRLLKELLISLDNHRIRIECDNTQTIRLVTEEIAKLQTKLRHVDIHNHWLRQEVRDGRIEVIYTESARMMADGLTKSLTNNAFESFVKQINLRNVDTQLETRRLDETAELDTEEWEPPDL